MESGTIDFDVAQCFPKGFVDAVVRAEAELVAGVVQMAFDGMDWIATYARSPRSMEQVSVMVMLGWLTRSQYHCHYAMAIPSRKRRPAGQAARASEATRRPRAVSRTRLRL